MKIKEVTKKIIPFLLIPFVLTGCSKDANIDVNCEIPARHVHKYISTANGINTYFEDEKVKIGDYAWQNDYIEITEDDAKYYEAKGKLFNGVDNWPYLFNVMKNNSKDYLEFYYSYTTLDTKITFDSEGDPHLKTETKNESGWSTNPNHQGVTGTVRICHHRFYGYRIVKKDGEYVLEQSPLVDDFREIIHDYPLFYEYRGCVKVVNQEYKYDIEILSSLKAEDFHDFTGPDLENETLGNVK